MTFKVPVGVVLAITPFNAPLNLICHKIGPAFAAGNAIILKPAPQTSAVATAFVKLLLEAEFPEKSVQLIIGGVDAGRQLVTDERTNLVSFTGGAVGGEHISNSAGLKKVLLELGGNGATIVHHDADIEKAASLCAKTGFSNSGQSCISVQRIYVHKEILATFTETLKEKVDQLIVGDPLSSESDIGCMVDEQAAKRVEVWIQEAEKMGASIISGGQRNGASVRPTILLSPPKQAKVVCEEVFGPVVSILPYEDLNEAIKEANDSRYGLQAGIFTSQLAVALHAAKELETGGVIINGTSNFRLDHWPYGGIKRSGIGREGPRFAIEEMTETKWSSFQKGYKGEAGMDGNAFQHKLKVVQAGGRPMVCTPLIGQTKEELLHELEVLAEKKPDVIEWRADFFTNLHDKEQVIETLHWMKDKAQGIPILFTIRSEKEGGEPISLSTEER